MSITFNGYMTLPYVSHLLFIMTLSPALVKRWVICVCDDMLLYSSTAKGLVPSAHSCLGIVWNSLLKSAVLWWIYWTVWGFGESFCYSSSAGKTHALNISGLTRVNEKWERGTWCLEMACQNWHGPDGKVMPGHVGTRKKQIQWAERAASNARRRQRPYGFSVREEDAVGFRSNCGEVCSLWVKS